MSGAIDWTYGPENPLVLGSCDLLTEKWLLPMNGYNQIQEEGELTALGIVP
jgi:hypothetical protein